MISGGLTLLALILALLARKPQMWLAALGMAVSTLGDGLLAGYPACFRPVKDRLVKGGLVFFAAHIVYILALIRIAGQNALLPSLWAPLAVFTALTLLHGLFFYLRSASRPPFSFFIAAFLYLLTVGVHAAMAFCVSGLTDGGLWLNIVGALFFYVSDAVLLAGKYGGIRWKRIDDVIWLTYIPAQFCLILGFFLA